jgi:hypothetical protein
VRTLAALLLETIAKDNLFDAVLDEAPYKPMSLQPEESEWLIQQEKRLPARRMQVKS